MKTLLFVIGTEAQKGVFYIRSTPNPSHAPQESATFTDVWQYQEFRAFFIRKKHLRRQVWLYLKEQCYEDFVVLAQFCAEIITLRL